jgi:hypothetical protein
MSKIPGVRRASIKEVEALSKLPWVRDEELSDRVFEIRLLPDGRVLQYLSDSDPGTLFPSREVFVEVSREIAARFAKKEPVNLTRTLLPPIDEFLRDVEAHAKSLGAKFRVPDDALDRTPASLDAVDAALRKIPKAKRETAEIVTPLVAYLGEVMRRACDGHWTKAPVRPHVATNENEPMIMGRDGRILQPFAIVIVPMVEPSKRILLRAAVDVYLLPYRPKGPSNSAG